jgi:hypothetical protein
MFYSQAIIYCLRVKHRILKYFLNAKDSENGAEKKYIPETPYKFCGIN